jgi:TonB family protein
MDERDGVVEAAQSLVGEALFLRGFYVGRELEFDANGKVKGVQKVGDWTLAAVNVLKVSRRGPGEIELDGVRAAIRYNADQHEFERHAQNDEKIRMVVEAVSVTGLEKAEAAMFAVGIDPGLQQSMPDYWRHYFNPALAWPKDDLEGVAIYPSLGLPNQPKDLVAAKVEHRVEAKMPEQGLRDKVRGQLLLQVVIGEDGVARRVQVRRPLGYGLDASSVEAVKRWRFSPATKEGKPVATAVIVAMDFEYVAPPR